MKGEKMTLDEAIAEVKAVYADDKLWTMATAEAKSVVFAAVLSGELVPATRAEDASVKLYEGCYGITRGGNGHPPAAHYVSATGNHTWAFKADRHTYRVNGRWSCDKHRLSHHDIIAVYATRAEAEAALAKAEGKTLQELDVKPGDVVRHNPTGCISKITRIENGGYFGDGNWPELPFCEDPDFTLVSRATAPAPDAARDERRKVTDEMVWALCPYTSNGDRDACSRCPEWEQNPWLGPVQRMCHGIAREACEKVLAALEARQ